MGVRRRDSEAPGYDPAMARPPALRKCRVEPSSLLSAPLFHKAKDSAPVHSIESKDNLVSIEDGDEPVHCTRGVMWAWRDVFSEDALGNLHSSQYRVLIRVVHGTRLPVDLAFKAII